MSELPYRHIAVEGPIGVGKTSLVTMLAKRFRGTKILEDADNPFLDDFYKDKRGAAFRTQLFFLLSRFDQQKAIAQRDLKIPVAEKMRAFRDLFRALKDATEVMTLEAVARP